MFFRVVLAVLISSLLGLASLPAYANVASPCGAHACPPHPVGPPGGPGSHGGVKPPCTKKPPHHC